MNDNREKLLRWLQVLFYIHLAGVLLSVLALASTAFSFAVGIWSTWAQRAVSLGLAVCLYLLPGRYRYAGMVKALGLLCSLVSLVLFRLLYAYGVQIDAAVYGRVINWLSRGAMVLSIVALCLEYTTHAQVVPADKTKWYILLGCSLAVTMLSYATMYILQPILQTMEMEEYLHFSKAWNVVVRSLGLVLSVANLVLLHRLVRHQEEV